MRGGVDPGIAIIPFRGEYYTLRPERASLVRHLVSPAPDPTLLSFGVHFTLRIDGQVEAGPNALRGFDREDWHRWAVSPRDVGAVLGFPGFWRMARRGTLVVEDAVRPRVAATRPSSAGAVDLQWSGRVVRVQAVDRSGRLLDDFHIAEGEAGVHLVNAPSPAATASLSVGKQLARRMPERLDA